MDTAFMEADRHGEPRWMFGGVDDDFYGLVGRIAVVAAPLEDRLHVLYGALAFSAESEKAGEPGTEVITACRRRLILRVGDGYPDHQRR